MRSKNSSNLFYAENIVGGVVAPLTRSTGYPDIITNNTEYVNIPGSSMTKKDLEGLTSSARPGYGMMAGGSRTRRNKRRNRKQRRSRRK